MAVFIEAIYEGGVLRPLISYNLQEHKRYRLMLVEEVPTSELPTDEALVDVLAQRTVTLEHGRLLLNMLDIFAQDGVDLSFEQIEATLRECRLEQVQEWDTLEQEPR
jgi:predicted DNA-binding antitoxin AbrB/MazE fold protein